MECLRLDAVKEAVPNPVGIHHSLVERVRNSIRVRDETKIRVRPFETALQFNQPLVRRAFCHVLEKRSVVIGPAVPELIGREGVPPERQRAGKAHAGALACDGTLESCRIPMTRIATTDTPRTRSPRMSAGRRWILPVIPT